MFSLRSERGLLERRIDLNEDKEGEDEMKYASFEEREWIDPWNDRRPMTDEWVLVTIFSNGLGKYVTMGKYEEDYGWFIDNDDSLLGWMPMPEPMGGYMPLEEPKFGEEWTRQ